MRAFVWSALWGITSAMRAITRELDMNVRARANAALFQERVREMHRHLVRVSGGC